MGLGVVELTYESGVSRMTNFEYRNWEPNQGLEEQQADVFNEANKYKLQPTTAEHIKKLNTKYNIKSEHVRYAFTGKKMVGYIHARVQEQVKEIVLSFPWTIPNTPTKVRDTLYNNIIQYFRDQSKFTNFQLRVNPMSEPKTNITFLLEHGFVIKNTWKELLLSLSSVANAKYNPKFTSRLGSEDDIEDLIELTKKDGSYAKQLDTDGKIRDYLANEIIPTDHVTLVYDNNVLCAACAPKVGENRLIMDFAVFNDIKNQEPFVPLFVELAKACVNSGYGKNKPILVYTDNMDTPVEEQEFLQQFTPIQIKTLMHYCYKNF
jgi:hypothetical protein